jgi:hypothetical protein
MCETDDFSLYGDLTLDCEGKTSCAFFFQCYR